MFNFGDVLGPGGGGLNPAPKTALVTKRGGDGSKGDLVALDLSNAVAGGEVTNNKVGDEKSGLRNVIAPVSDDLNHGVLAVLVENISDDKPGRAVFEGECYAYVQKNSGNIAKGDPLYASTNGYLDADGVAGNKVVAIALEAKTGPSTAVLCRVGFSGVYALGVKTS